MSRLGRGLEALLSNSFSVRKIEEAKNLTSENKSGVLEVEIEKIQVNPYQPRKNFDEIGLNELAQSIKEHGILQPLLVTKNNNGGFELLVGERRFHAAKRAGLKKVPVMIKNAKAIKKLELALVENIQRKDLNPMEKAMAFSRLKEEFGLTQEEIAKKVGKSRPEVTNIIRLLSLSPEIQKAVFEEKITAGHAKAILGLNDSKKQLEMLRQIINYKLPVREVENQVKKIKVRSSMNKEARKDPDTLALEEKMREALGTRVSIKKRGSRGSIVVEFYSQEELFSLVSRISREGE